MSEEITTPTMTIRFRPRVHNWREPWRTFEAKPRVYVDVDDFDLFENLENRFRRPYKFYRKYVLEALELMGMDEPRIGWSQKAGCSCGCSPGFIVQSESRVLRDTRHWDMWITIAGAPAADEAKPARLLVPSLV